MHKLELPLLPTIICTSRYLDVELGMFRKFHFEFRLSSLTFAVDVFCRLDLTTGIFE